MVEVPRSLNSLCLRYGFLPTCSCTPGYPQGKAPEEKFPDIAASTVPERLNKDLSISPCINTGRQPRQAAPGGGSTDRFKSFARSKSLGTTCGRVDLVLHTALGRRWRLAQANKIPDK